MPYRVTAPLLIIKDEAGRNHHTYHGGVAHYLNEEQKAHFLRLGLVEEFGVEAPAEPAAESHKDSAPVKPAKTAPEPKWVDYGAELGHDRAELETLSKPELIDLLG